MCPRVTHIVGDFNPPSPCGEGRLRGGRMNAPCKFQSTLPMRGGTSAYASPSATRAFQSTLPMRGGTPLRTGVISKISYFNPPSPCGEGRTAPNTRYSSSGISIHPPHAGRDPCACHHIPLRIISIHPPHAGRDPFLTGLLYHANYFNPPSPCGEGPIAIYNK